MAAPQDVPIPEIFVLWHPRCPLGEKLARRILQWLRPGNGLGPEVFFRCLPAPGAAPNARPLPLPLTQPHPGEAPPTSDAYKTPNKVSNLQVVLALIEENLVADQTWRFWLEELALDSGRVIMPVALDTTAYNMPAAVRKLNYLRPNGLPLPAGDALAGPAFEEVVRSLLKQITEALCRVMLPKPAEAPAGRSSAPNSPLPKVNIFLSHAKVDGTRPARRLRDYIYSQNSTDGLLRRERHRLWLGVRRRDR